jgi:cobalamin transport system substrate-binding protein
VVTDRTWRVAHAGSRGSTELAARSAWREHDVDRRPGGMGARSAEAAATRRRGRPRSPWRRLGLGLLAVLACSTALVTTAFGAAATTGFPVTISAANGAVTLAARPTRIISLSPSATEMLFAIGAGAQVVAVDDDSDYPKRAPRTALSGLEPNVEAIAKYRPDLVVIDYNPQGFAAKLEALHVPVIVDPAVANLAGSYAQIDELGVATGHRSSALAVVANMRHRIAALVASSPHFSPPLSYYFELDQTYYSATSATFIGEVLRPLGMRNIADAAKGAAGGYPQLSAEYILKADPSVILLADTICCHQSAATVARRPGWSAITAVRDGAVIGLNDDIASRWGPRVVDLLADVEAGLWKLKKRLGG